MRGGCQIVGTNGGEVALTELGQRGGFVVVGEHAEVDAPGDHPVLDVMHRVGDVVSPIHDLGLQAGPICGRAVAHPLGGAAVDVVEAELATMPIPRPRVFGDRIQPGPSQIQADAMPVQVKNFGLQAGQDPEVLRISLEAAIPRRELVEGLLAVVAVRRVPDVVGQTGHVDEVGIAAQFDRHPPADLGDLQRMRQSGTGCVSFPWPDDLCLVREPTKRGTMQNPGAIPGEVGAALTLGARQARDLRRLGHHPLAVEIVVGILLSHRRPVCQPQAAVPRSALHGLPWDPARRRARLSSMSTLRRSVAVFMAMLITGLTGLVVAPSATAQPPFRLSGYITDNAGALNGSGRAAIQTATGKLYSDRHIQLWVVFVDDFSGQPAVSWTENTRAASDLGDFDAILAVATVDHSYAFLVPHRVQTIGGSQVDDLRRNQIEPALRRGDWSGAAVAAANGLDRRQQPASAAPLLIGLGVILAAALALYVFTRYRRRRRRAAELAAAKRVDSTDPDALAALSLGALDDLSRWKVVDVDNAVRTSANELALTIEEFGEQRTQPFTGAVDKAKAALSQAFTVRQQLDDAIPETRAQRRELVVNAPSRLDALTQQVVDLTARIAPAEQRMTELHNEFDSAALASVATNVTTAKDRLAFADQNLSRARELAARPVSGEQSGLVDAVHAAESSLGQARSLLDAVDSAANDIRHAVATLPSLIADVQSGIEHANTALQNTQQAKAPHLRDLASARTGVAQALDLARTNGSSDPLASFTGLTKANADLSGLLATVAEEQATAERLTRTLEQALFTAQSRVHAVSEYIDNRRGSIGPEARTRLAEAGRQIEAAQDKKASDLSEATTHANNAASLAAQAQSLAEADVQSAQRAYTSRYGSGNQTGAMMGGIIIGDMLGGAMRGGFGGGGFGGGWGPTSFGGSGSDGGFMGGGGRF